MLRATMCEDGAERIELAATTVSANAAGVRKLESVCARWYDPATAGKDWVSAGNAGRSRASPTRGGAEGAPRRGGAVGEVMVQRAQHHLKQCSTPLPTRTHIELGQPVKIDKMRNCGAVFALCEAVRNSDVGQQQPAARHLRPATTPPNANLVVSAESHRKTRGWTLQRRSRQSGRDALWIARRSIDASLRTKSVPTPRAASRARGAAFAIAKPTTEGHPECSGNYRSQIRCPCNDDVFKNRRQALTFLGPTTHHNASLSRRGIASRSPPSPRPPLKPASGIRLRAP